MVTHRWSLCVFYDTLVTENSGEVLVGILDCIPLTVCWLFNHQFCLMGALLRLTSDCHLGLAFVQLPFLESLYLWSQRKLFIQCGCVFACPLHIVHKVIQLIICY